MAGKIPEETIQQIKQSVEISDVISDYVQLKKQGRNYFGLCPFHGEKSPSFSVSPDKQIYHCFGCGAGGNVFSFLTEIENISFQEAVSKLAGRAGISVDIGIPADGKGNSGAQAHSKMYEAHELLAKFYHHLLLNTKEGQEALEYLYGRGFVKEDLDAFQVGWSLPNWDFTANFLKKRGFSPEEMEKAGLIIQKEGANEYFDRFRGRVMFPLHDAKGKVVGFSGRSLTNDQPKYLNSPETPIFNKSTLLYNFHRARPAIRKQHNLVLFEGFADVIAAAKAGIETGIATMGTALTDSHIQQIKRSADEVIICYDGDSAGIQAAFRAASMLDESGCELKVALLPEKLDPDDYIKRYGTEKFRNNIIGNSMTLMTFKMEYYKLGKNLQDEAQRLKYIEDILTEIARLKKAVERDYYLRQIAEQFSLSLDALKQQEKQMFFSNRKKPENARPVLQASAPRQSQRMYPAFQTAERRLIAHMLRDEEVCYKVREQLGGESFNLDEHQAVFTYLLGYYEAGHSPDSSIFINILPDPNLRRLITDIEMMAVADSLTDEEMSDYIKMIFQQRKYLEIKVKKQEQQAAERINDHKAAAQIAMEIMKLTRSLK